MLRPSSSPAQTDLAVQSGFGEGLISKIAFDDSGQYLAAVSHSPVARTVTLWEISTRTLIKSYRVPLQPDEAYSTPSRISFIDAPKRIQVESRYALETWEINSDTYQRIALFPQDAAKDLQRSEVANWSASGKYLVSGSAIGWSGLISITEIESGKHEIIDLNYPPATIAISDDDSTIVTSIGNQAHIYNRESKQRIRNFEVDCARVFGSQVFKKADLVVFRGRKKGVPITLVHSLKTGKEIYQFTNSRATSAPVVIPGQDKVIWTKKIDGVKKHILSASLSEPTKSEIRISTYDTVWGIAFSLQNNLLAIAGTDPYDPSKISLYDFQTGQLLGKLATDIEFGGTVYAPATKKLYQSRSSGLYEWDLTTGRRSRIRSKPIGGSLSFSTGNKLFFSQDKRFAVFSIEDGNSGRANRLTNYAPNDSLGGTLSANGRYLASLNRDQSVDVIDMQNDQKLFRIVRPSGEDQKIGPIANMVPTGDGTQVCLSDVLGNLEVWNVPERRRVFSKNHPQLISKAAANRSAVFFTKAIGSDFILTGEMGTWRLDGQRTLKHIDNRPIVFNVRISPNGKLLFAATTPHECFVLNLETGEELSRLPIERLKFASVHFIDQQRLVAIRYSGVFEIWSVESSALLATCLPIRNNGYAIVTPEGFVKSNQTGLGAVAFRNGLLITPFGRWCQERLRPDLVMKSIGLSSPEYLKQLDTLVQWKLGQDSEPVERLKKISALKLERPLPLFSPESSIEVAISEAQFKGLTELTVDVNGVRQELLPDQRRRFRIQLLRGDNRIVMSGREKDKRCVIVHHVFCDQPAQKKTTWFVGLGISRYQNEAKNLDFAAKDVSDLADELQELAGGDFQRLLLRDQSATKEKVLASAGEFIRKASPQDTLIFTLAGHGFVEAGSYQFALHDCSFDESNSGALSLAEIEELVAQSPARRRVVMLDTCHAGSELPGTKTQAQSNGISFKPRSLDVSSSGAVSQQQDQFRKQMLEQFGNQVGMSGTTVISASNAGQFALESADWNNGAFTYAVREAIRSKAADVNSDGKINVQELTNYVEEFVAKLTGGRQRPEARFLNSALDTDLIVATEPTEHAVQFDHPEEDSRSPSVLEIDPSGQYAVVADKNRIQMLNLKSGETRSWETNSKNSIHKFQFTKNLEHLIVWHYEGQIDAIHLTTDKQTNLAPEGSPLSFFVLSDDMSIGAGIESFSKQLTRYQFTSAEVEIETVDIDEVRAVESHTVLPDNRHLRVLTGGVIKDINLHTGRADIVVDVEINNKAFGDRFHFFDSGKWLVKHGVQSEQSGPELFWLNVQTGEAQQASSARPLCGIRFDDRTLPLPELGKSFTGATVRERFLFETRTRKPINEHYLDINDNEEVTVSGDQRFATVSKRSLYDGKPNRGFRVYSLSTGKEIAWLNPGNDFNHDFAFGKDNKKLYAVDSRWRLWVWKLE